MEFCSRIKLASKMLIRSFCTAAAEVFDGSSSACLTAGTRALDGQMNRGGLNEAAIAADREGRRAIAGVTLLLPERVWVFQPPLRQEFSDGRDKKTGSVCPDWMVGDAGIEPATPPV